MDNIEYLEQSERTASSQFHLDVATPGEIRTALHSAVATGDFVDKVKKGLFYGKIFNVDDVAHPEPPMFDVNAVHPDVLHAALGIFTEAVELIENILVAMESGGAEEFNEVNAFEEIGDVEWYMAMMYRYLKKTPEQAKVTNIAKLYKRFPDKFDSELANDRDIAAELEILEAGAAS